jgi:hypothetical protein
MFRHHYNCKLAIIVIVNVQNGGEFEDGGVFLSFFTFLIVAILDLLCIKFGEKILLPRYFLILKLPKPKIVMEAILQFCTTQLKFFM